MVNNESHPGEDAEVDAQALKNGLSTWDEARRIADEIEVKIHLAAMDARDRWHQIEPQVADLERRLRSGGKRVSEAVIKEIKHLRELLDGLRDDVRGN